MAREHDPPALPSELWTQIFASALESDDDALNSRGSHDWSRKALLSVCKTFHDIALPLFYSRIRIFSLASLDKFATRLADADKKWDSLRRTPYSAPGRWVHALDVSAVAFLSLPEAFALDALLAALFPLTPALARLTLNPGFVLSRRALAALAGRPEVLSLRVLEGFSYVPGTHGGSEDRDALVQLLRRARNMEAMEIVGPGLDPTEYDPGSDHGLDGAEADPPAPLDLPHLHTLTLLALPAAPLLRVLLHTPLPALRKLTLTPYDDVPAPAALATQFIATHGAHLRSLLLFTPKSWPTRLHPSPPTLLLTSPFLRHLSLESPLPRLALPPNAAESAHPLQILSIPRPGADCWAALAPLLPRLPALRAVRARDVRWLRRGMTSKAQGAGVQGEMREWARRLARRGIRVLDAEWRECE